MLLLLDDDCSVSIFLVKIFCKTGKQYASVFPLEFCGVAGVRFMWNKYEKDVTNRQKKMHLTFQFSLEP